MRLGLLLLFLAGPVLLRADSQLSPPRLNQLDQRGYFTPSFKQAVHDLVQARQAVAQAHADEKRLNESLPDLQKQSDEAVAEAARLRKELALYTHPEDTDFNALQTAMKNSSTTPGEKLTLAQAFVWSYPTDPHQAEAQEDLQQIQRDLARQREAAKEAAIAQAAARATLVQRAKARNLSLGEWRDFLRDMSQEDLLTYLGRPEIEEADYWIYSGAWTWDPATRERTGLRIDFNGTRVLNVVPAAP
jgi:hypothetical protein